MHTIIIMLVYVQLALREIFDWLLDLLLMRGVWKSVITTCGVRCVIKAGTSMTLE